MNGAHCRNPTGWLLGHLRGVHARQNDTGFALQPWRVSVFVIEARVRHHCGEGRGFRWAELRRTHPEVVARRRLATEHLLTPFDDIQVDLEDSPLAHQALEHQRDDRFLCLAPWCPYARKEQVLGELLADGRTAGDDPALLLVLFDGALNAVPVESFVV